MRSSRALHTKSSFPTKLPKRVRVQNLFIGTRLLHMLLAQDYESTKFCSAMIIQSVKNRINLEQSNLFLLDFQNCMIKMRLAGSSDSYESESRDSRLIYNSVR